MFLTFFNGFHVINKSIFNFFCPITFFFVSVLFIHVFHKKYFRIKIIVAFLTLFTFVQVHSVYMLRNFFLHNI